MRLSRHRRHLAPARGAPWLLPAGALAVTVLISAGPGPLHAASLFDPRPQESMRSLSADRPCVTRSPYTVDAGHVQVEANLFSLARERTEAFGSDISIEELRLAEMNVKVGLSDRVDFQIVLAPYIRTRVESYDYNRVENEDMVFRLKVNLVGNEGGAVAVGLLPFVSPPTSSLLAPPSGGIFGRNRPTRDPSFGLAVPVAIALPGDARFGLMGQVEVDNGSYAYLFTTAISQPFIGALAGFLEIAAERVELGEIDGVSIDPDELWNSTLDWGLAFRATPDLQLDGAVRLGLSEEADDWTTSVGMTVRR